MGFYKYFPLWVILLYFDIWGGNSIFMDDIYFDE